MEAVTNGRRSFFVAGLAAVLVLTAVVAVRSVENAKATSGGSPYDVPDVVDTNPDPSIVETSITADEAIVDVGLPDMAIGMAFNGTIPGPTFHLKVGDTVIVHFHNSLLSEATGIHWHGIELDNASDGTPLTQNQVQPGGDFLYKFKVPRPGVFWYHPHHHSSTNQVFKGLYGAIIVTDPNEAPLIASGVIPNASRTRTVVLSDITLCKSPTNDAVTYPPGGGTPWSGPGPYPGQASPFPTDLCDTPMDDHGAPIPGPLPAGAVPNIQIDPLAPIPGPQTRMNEGQTVLTNGKNVGGRAGSPSAPGLLNGGASVLNVERGQGLRLQMINSSAIRYMRLRLTDSAGTQIPLIRIGGEGGLLDAAVLEGTPQPPAPATFDFKYDTGEILLGPGDRADVVAAIPAGAPGGVATMWTEDFSRTGMTFSGLPTVPVMHLNLLAATGAYTIPPGTLLRAAPAINQPVEDLGLLATNTLLDPAGFGLPGMVSPVMTLNNSLGTPDRPLGFNGIGGAHDNPGDYTAASNIQPGSARYAKVGDVLQLQVQNMTGAHHPYHLHGFSIQPISLTIGGGPNYVFPYHEFMDEIDIPAGYTLTFRVRIDDRPMMDGVTPGGAVGRWVMHCHIFFHAVFGMISELDIVAADGNQRPFVNTALASVTVNEGQVAADTGTFSDPNSDPVTLTASIGTVVPTGPGTWSWSFGTSRGPDQSQVVYITATDSHALKNQTAFQLTSLNLPPAVTINQDPGQVDPALNPPVNFRVVFDEPVTGFATGDVTLTGTALPTTGTVTPPGTGTTFNVSVNGMSAAGTVIATVGANRAADVRGAPNLASTSVDNTVFFKNGDSTPPACAVVAVRRPGPSGRDEMDVRVTDTQSGLLNITNISVTNGVISITPSVPFAPGVTQATVTAVKTIQGQPTKFSFDATDRALNVLHCT